MRSRPQKYSTFAHMKKRFEMPENTVFLKHEDTKNTETASPAERRVFSVSFQLYCVRDGFVHKQKE
jgi:hypothetical protein